jgi:two-component system sensor histidine kinase DegS
MTEDTDRAGARGVAGEPVGPSADALARRLRDEVVTIDEELSEIAALIEHARAEAARHEGKRAAASDRLLQRPPASTVEARELAELAKQVALLTRRAAVMEAQIDVLEGKQRALSRYRDAVERIAVDVGELARIAPPAAASTPPQGRPTPASSETPHEEVASLSAARSVIGAQEDLRRQIARSLHDGPVQGLTNIALQAQIVERLAERSPAQVADEARALVAMVQSTLETTKTFLFEVRPMVLDDLGLVPTLRRAARERARSRAVTVDLDSRGQDRRLAGEVESGLFRIVDDALAAYVETGADRVSLVLDWAERLTITVASTREARPGEAVEAVAPSADLPPALAEMIEDRRLAGRPHLGDALWHEIRARAIAIGAMAELHDEGSELRVLGPVIDRP